MHEVAVVSPVPVGQGLLYICLLIADKLYCNDRKNHDGEEKENGHFDDYLEGLLDRSASGPKVFVEVQHYDWPDEP